MLKEIFVYVQAYMILQFHLKRKDISFNFEIALKFNFQIISTTFVLGYTWNYILRMMNIEHRQSTPYARIVRLKLNKIEEPNDENSMPLYFYLFLIQYLF